MKKVIIFSALVFCVLVNGQVGIETDDPKSTLHVMEPSNLENTQTGIIPPRMSTTDRDKMDLSEDQNGLIIYNTDEQCLQQYKVNIWRGVNCLDTDMAQISGRNDFDTSSAQFFGQDNLDLSNEMSNVPNFSSEDDFIDDDSLSFIAPEGWYRLTVESSYFSINGNKGITVDLNYFQNKLFTSFLGILNREVGGNATSFIGGSKTPIIWEYSVDKVNDEVTVYGFHIGGEADFKRTQLNDNWVFALHNVGLLEGQTVRINSSRYSNVLIEHIMD